MVVALLSESFGESMLLPSGYVTLLGFLVKQYLIERRGLLPHTATLVGFYRESEGENLELAGTLEVCFDRRGANASIPSPTPPKDSPYICNMTVTKPLRRYSFYFYLEHLEFGFILTLYDVCLICVMFNLVKWFLD